MPGPAAPDALLATKLSVPRGPKAAVVRHRLLDQLDPGVQGPVTLVAAPAGAGKSALLSSWIAEDRPPGPVAWLSLDTDDADRRRFWRGVLAALAKATGDDAVAALAVSPREPMSMGLVAPALADALEGRQAAGRARARRLPRGRRRRPRGPRTARALPAAGPAARHRHARGPADRARPSAPRRPPDRDPRGRSELLAGRGRRAVRCAGHRAGARGSRDAVAAHRGLGGSAAPRGRVVGSTIPTRAPSSSTSPAPTRRSATTWSARCWPASRRSCATSCCAPRSSRR